MSDPLLPPSLRRVLAAAAVVLYALVALLLVPLHRIEEVAPPAGGEPGLALRAVCDDADCGEPSHGHRDGHAHEDASCPACAQARLAAAPAPAGSVLVPSGGAADRAVDAAPAAVRAAARGLPPARGPPAFLS